MTSVAAEEAAQPPGLRAVEDDGPVIVGPRCRFEGILVFRGRARVEGEVLGEIVCRGALRLGRGARVEGAIEADELVVEGELRGDARVRGRIELCPTARVEGVIRASRVALAEGCVLDGRCETLPD